MFAGFPPLDLAAVAGLARDLEITDDLDGLLAKLRLIHQCAREAAEKNRDAK